MCIYICYVYRIGCVYRDIAIHIHNIFIYTHLHNIVEPLCGYSLIFIYKYHISTSLWVPMATQNPQLRNLIRGMCLHALEMQSDFR